MADTYPRILFASDDPSGMWRIVRVEIPQKQRENLDDDGVRDLIEVTDGRDLLGNWRWKQLDTKGEGVAGFSRICHALKRELLARLERDHAKTE